LAQKKLVKVIQSYNVEKRFLPSEGGNPVTNSPKAKRIGYDVRFSYEGKIYGCFLPEYLDKGRVYEVRRSTIFDNIFRRAKKFRELQYDRPTGRSIKLVFLVPGYTPLS